MTSVARIGMFTVLLATLGGCIPVTTHPPMTRTLIVPEAPAIAYMKAVQTTLAMGGTIKQQNFDIHVIQAFVGGKASLDVVIYPAGAGSKIVVQHRMLPTYFIAGTDGTLAEEFLTYYAQKL